MLINNQNEIVEEMFMALSEKKLFNIPTGVGKTYIFIALAQKIKEKLNKKVIISTSTNQLVKELYSVANEHFFIPKDEMKIQIGKSNYLDYNQYLFYKKTKELENYIEEQSLIHFENTFANEDKGQIFLSDFNNIVKYKDIASVQHINELLMYKGRSEDLFAKDINFTNHFFLISAFKNLREDVLGDYVLLMDETHTIGDVAQTVLSQNFSLFSTLLSLNRLNKEVVGKEDFVGKEAIKKNLRTLLATTNKMMKNYSNPGKIDNLGDEKQTKSYISKLDTFYNSKTTQTLMKQLKKHNKLFSREANIIVEEISNLQKIAVSAEKDINYVNLSYTPSRGYPLITSFAENPLGFLNRILWQKLHHFVGVSATICPSFNPSKKEKQYALSRIGLLGESKEIIFYDKFFPKELIDIYTPTKETPDYVSIYDKSFNEDDSIYYEYVVDFINKNHRNKNTMIFCGGYKEAHYISNLYKSLFNDVNVIAANQNNSSAQTLKEFKQNGGLLFATRDYGTGVTLKGELLENIFILRLPYPITSNFKWEKLRKKSNNIFMLYIKYEMLINLMQWLGRLQRTSEDSGSIFLLDKRYIQNTPLKSKIDEILNYYGNIKENTDTGKKITRKLDEDTRQTAVKTLDSLIGF